MTAGEGMAAEEASEAAHAAFSEGCRVWLPHLVNICASIPASTGSASIPTNSTLDVSSLSTSKYVYSLLALSVPAESFE